MYFKEYKFSKFLCFKEYNTATKGTYRNKGLFSTFFAELK